LQIIEGLFVVRPQPNDIYYVLSFDHLIDKAMLDVSSSRERPSQVTDQLLEWRRGFERITFQDCEKLLNLTA